MSEIDVSECNTWVFSELREKYIELKQENEILHRDIKELIKNGLELREENEKLKEKNSFLQHVYCIALEKDCYKHCKQEDCKIKNCYNAEQKLEKIKEIIKQLSISINWNINKNAYEKLQNILQIIESEK